MIGFDTLLFPDTGADFLRSLRTAILYSKQVHVLTMFDSRTVKWAEAFGEADNGKRSNSPFPSWDAYSERLTQYARFVTENHKDLLLLKDAVVLAPLSWGQVREPRNQAAESIRQRIKTSEAKIGKPGRLKKEITEPLHRAVSECPPTFFDLELLDVISRHDAGEESESQRNFWRVAREHGGEDALASVCGALFMPYLLSLSLAAENRGIALMSWSPHVRDAVWMMRERFTKPGTAAQSRLPLRHNAQAVLGHLLLEKYLPRVADNAPFEDILKMRQCCADELEAFHVGVAEVAAQVDPTQWREDCQLQASDPIATRVDPAVKNLKEALKAPRRGVLSNIWLAATPIAIGLSFIAGAPLDLVAAIGLLGTGIQMFEGSGEEKNLPNASQWSILLGEKGVG